MTTVAADVYASPGVGSGLIDLSSFSLAALRQIGNEMLDAAIRRITEQAEGEPVEAVCAFNSAL